LFTCYQIQRYTDSADGKAFIRRLDDAQDSEYTEVGVLGTEASPPANLSEGAVADNAPAPVLSMSAPVAVTVASKRRKTDARPKTIAFFNEYALTKFTNVSRAQSRWRKDLIDQTVEGSRLHGNMCLIFACYFSMFAFESLQHARMCAQHSGLYAVVFFDRDRRVFESNQRCNILDGASV
jgi:hypothetical protein